MGDKDRLVLEKILRHINAVLSYCEGCATLADFQSDSKLVEASVFNLMQIGELAKMSLSDELKERLVSIPWVHLYGMRNRIVHGYDGINFSIVWTTISEDLPKLRGELTAALGSLS